MLYSLISDMHIDFAQPPLDYAALENNVIVAGDTSNGLVGLKFLDKLKSRGFNVFAIDGNHEHYANVSQRRTREETQDAFRERYPNIGMFGDIPVIGCCGWYRVQDARDWFGYMNDGPNIFNDFPELAASKMNTACYKDFMFLDNEIHKVEKCIVVTHMAPTEETLDKRFRNHYSNQWYFNPFFIDLIRKYRDKILVWNHGHTHSACDMIVEGVRVVCNPRGYPGENPTWKPKTIEV